MSTIDDLTEQEQRLIAADFAEHVLPLFEADYPDDDRPRKAIEAARAFARGEVTRTQLKAARAAAGAAEREWQQDRIFEVVAARAQEQPAPSVAVFRARLLDKWGIAQLDIDHLIDAVRREARL